MPVRVTVIMSNPIDRTQIMLDLTPYLKGNVTDEDIDNYVYSIYPSDQGYDDHPHVPEEQQRFDVFDTLLKFAARYHPYYSVIQENPRLREDLMDRDPDTAGLIRWAAFHKPNTLKNLDRSLRHEFGVDELRQAGEALRAELKKQRSRQRFEPYVGGFIHNR